MALKLMGGIAKGMTLKAPPETLTRPTSALLRRRVFDAVQSFSGSNFYDLCAGSGSIGLEAWSRGADKVHFIENQRKVYSVLSKNLQLISERYSEEAKLRPLTSEMGSAYSWLHSALVKNNNILMEQNILFFDPPYEDHTLYHQILSLFGQYEQFAGEIWVESEKRKGPNLTDLTNYVGNVRWRWKKVYSQGNRFIARGVFKGREEH